MKRLIDTIDKIAFNKGIRESKGIQVVYCNGIPWFALSLGDLGNLLVDVLDSSRLRIGGRDIESVLAYDKDGRDTLIERMAHILEDTYLK